MSELAYPNHKAKDAQFEAGELAGFMGMPHNTNPYPYPSGGYKEWSDGWLQGQAAAQRVTAKEHKV